MPNRRLVLPIALAIASLLAVGCAPEPLTKRQMTQAIRITEKDDRLSAFLDTNTYHIVEVRRPTGTATGLDDAALVTVVLAQPAPFDSWPLDTCDIGRASNEVTGVVWLVDLEAKTLYDVSPRWGGVDCIDA